MVSADEARFSLVHVFLILLCSLILDPVTALWELLLLIGDLS